VDLLHALLQHECAQVEIRNEELSALERDVVQDVPAPVQKVERNPTTFEHLIKRLTLNVSFHLYSRTIILNISPNLPP